MTTTLQIIEDGRRRPDLFHWFGAIPSERLARWLRQSGLPARVPADLESLWLETGGGDYFESETILGPFADPSMGDDVLGHNRALHSQGLPAEYLVFSRGLELGAVDLRTGEFIDLDKSTFSARGRFKSLNEWYLRTARKDLGKRYGLA